MRQTIACLLALAGMISIGCCAELLPGAADLLTYEADFSGGQAHGWQPLNNLEPFGLAEGHLSTRATGGDAHMSVGGLALTTEDISHLRFRMRSDRVGVTQVYFTTTASPDPAANGVPTVGCRGDGQWHEYEVQLTGVSGFQGQLTMLRLDPVNGGGEQAEIDFEWIRLIQKAPVIVCSGFSTDKPIIAPGETTTLTLKLTNFGGGSAGDLKAELTGSSGVNVAQPAADVEWPEGGDSGTAAWEIEGRKSGICELQARVSFRGTLAAQARLHLPVFAEGDMQNMAASSREPAIVGNQHVALQFLGSAVEGQSKAAYSAALLRVADGDTWRTVGIISPLAQAAYRRDGVEYWDEPAMSFSRRDVLTATVGESELSLRVEPGRDAHARDCIALATTLRQAPGPVRRFSGPVLRVGMGEGGGEKTGALFPGIEFLEENEPSSNRDVVGDTVGYRPSPVPYQITVPMIAVLKDDCLTGMMWAGETGREAMPVGEFASPNFLDGQDNHHLACFLPGEPYRAPNQAIASRPSEQPRFELRTVLFALPSAGLDAAVPLWYETYGLPRLRKLAHTPEEALDICIQGWAQTLWFPEVRGFNNHWRIGQKPYWDGGLAANILAHSLRTGEKRWVEALDLEPDSTLLSLSGSMFEDPRRPGTPESAKTQVDGLWPYEPAADLAEKVKEWTGGKRDNLGEPGSFNVGVAANQAIGLLSHAVQWGDEGSLAAGLKALEAMEKYSVPRGCQGWEVHIEIPDIYAAARIIDCYRMGYELTGEDRWLERAIYWARTGLPFLYSYEVGDTGPGVSAHIPWPEDTTKSADAVFDDPGAHHVTPWASIPVFGTSFYRVTWFGNPVQWCGLCWAKSVYPLLQHVDDPLLRAAADGVVLSGINQTYDKEPYVGLLPDTWHLSSNIAHPALIGPVRLEDPLRLMIDRPDFGRAETRVALRTNQTGEVLERAHITSRARLSREQLGDISLGWTARFVPGQVCETRVVLARQPKSIAVDGRAIPPVEDILKTDEGWTWLADIGAVAMRVKHQEEEVSIVVTF